VGQRPGRINQLRLIPASQYLNLAQYTPSSAFIRKAPMAQFRAAAQITSNRILQSPQYDRPTQAQMALHYNKQQQWSAALAELDQYAAITNQHTMRGLGQPSFRDCLYHLRARPIQPPSRCFPAEISGGRFRRCGTKSGFILHLLPTKKARWPSGSPFENALSSTDLSQ